MTTFFRCTRCLYPNTKPDLWFDEHGVCSACLAYDARASINWADRQDAFVKLCRDNPGKSHDVIVACSGGKDSTAQVVKCLELGLRPLAVCATTDHLSTLGRKNLDNIASLCDLVEVTPNKPTRRKIARFALEEVGDISWCEHHLIWSIPPRESVGREIPIVLYGECPQSEYGAGPRGSEKEQQLTPAWMHEFGGLLGLRLSDILDIGGIEGVISSQLELYRHPTSVRAVLSLFMGYYFPWDGYQNFLVARDNGFTPYPGDIEGSLYGYENLDNLQTGLHDRLRWLKFGYSRACDIASNHIRRGRLTRQAAVELVHYRERQPFYSYLDIPLEEILAPLGMHIAAWYAVCERFTNKPVVEWALRLESFQCFSGASTVPSKASSFTNAALVRYRTDYAFLKGETSTS